MKPVLFELELFGLTRPIGGYGTAIALGMLITVLFTLRAGKRAGVDYGTILAACGYTIGGGLLGAYLTFLGVELARSGALPERAGLVFYGSVPGGLLGAWFASRAMKIPMVPILDEIVPGIALGHALGRVGCFLGGCCFGAPHGTIWAPGALAVTFTDPAAPGAHPAIPRHAVQLYEAGGLVLLALAFALAPAPRGDGRRALAYVVAYGVLRLVTEAFRGDALRGVWGPLSTSQIVSLAGIAVAAALLLRQRQRARAAEVA